LKAYRYKAVRRSAARGRAGAARDRAGVTTVAKASAMLARECAARWGHFMAA
jgi:hypothetical protein